MHYQNQINSLHHSSATCFGVCFPSMGPTPECVSSRSGLCWWWLQGISHYQLHQECVRAMCMTSGGTDVCQELWLQSLGRCTTKTKSTAYTTLVRPVLEYASPVWGPHQITTTRDIDRASPKWAARFVYNCYQDNSPGCDKMYIVRLPCRLSVLWWKPGDGIQPDLKVL
jgi:hypothetical protein